MPGTPEFEIHIDPAQQLVQLSQRRSEFDLRPTGLVIPWSVLKAVMGQVLLLEVGAHTPPSRAPEPLAGPVS